MTQPKVQKLNSIQKLTIALISSTPLALFIIIPKLNLDSNSNVAGFIGLSLWLIIPIGLSFFLGFYSKKWDMAQRIAYPLKFCVFVMFLNLFIIRNRLQTLYRNTNDSCQTVIMGGETQQVCPD